MYVAAPVTDRGRIIGVLSVGKPNSAIAPVIKRSERRMLWASTALLGIALVIGFGVTLWINRSIGKLTRYADAVSEKILYLFLTREVASCVSWRRRWRVCALSSKEKLY